MKKTATIIAVASAALLTQLTTAEETMKTADYQTEPAKVITLPQPDRTGGMPLMKTMAERKSTRAYNDKKLDDQTLSSLLWAAGGISRPDGKRTAGSTCNWQCIDIYVMLKTGIYFYNAKANTLELVTAGDHTALAGMQDFAKDAPVNILFVGDLDKMNIPTVEKKYLYLGSDIGLMSQNIYLFCASNGLITVLRGSVDPAPLGKVMKLPPYKVVLEAQSVGWAN